jgi:hypothetical protein
MHQRDYILRMIEQIGRILVALRKRILSQPSDVADVDDAFRTLAGHAGIDLEVARRSTPETLILLTSPQLEPTRCWTLAELLYLDGLNAQTEERNEDARSSYEKAMRLFAFVQPGGAMLLGWPEAADRIAEIEERLRALP